MLDIGEIPPLLDEPMMLGLVFPEEESSGLEFSLLIFLAMSPTLLIAFAAMPIDVLLGVGEGATDSFKQVLAGFCSEHWV